MYLIYVCVCVSVYLVYLQSVKPQLKKNMFHELPRLNKNPPHTGTDRLRPRFLCSLPRGEALGGTLGDPGLNTRQQ